MPFVRRYTSEPTEAELLKIEGVVIIDGKPVAQVRGTGTGTVLCVGELEDGAFCVDGGPVEVLGDDDFARRFGGFGFTYDGIPGQNPCARSRLADSAIAPELWNGSGFVQLRSSRFSRLFIARVDASVGSVAFSRLASIAGTTNPTHDLEPAQTLKLKIDGAGAVTVTWDAAVATILSADGTYPSTFSGGEWIDFAIDGVTIRATFLDADETHTQVVARMNAAAGYTAFVEATLKTRINGRIRGTDGSVRIVAVSSSLVTTATGFTPAAAVNGTGDVGNIDLVTDEEFIARVEADAPGASGGRDYAGRLAVFSTNDIDGTIEVDSTGTATAFGFPTDVEADAAAGVDGSLPAGTRVRASGSGQEFVTMQTLKVTAANPGPYAVKVRHALDDQTGTSEIAGDIDTVVAPLQVGAFLVTNLLPVTAALTDSQLDTRYDAAIAKTRGVGSPARQINISFSARQSNAVRASLKQNAIDASAQGCFGRVTCVRPPLGTSRDAARGDAQPGVGAYRSDRVIYCYPGVRKRVPEIAAVGTSGGTGFTDDGIVNVGWDMGVAALCSNIPPEQNIGQVTEGIVDWVLGVESGNDDVADLKMEDYVAFKAAGIVAPQIDGGVVAYSAVTSSDDPALAPINRRRFADFYQDSISVFAKRFVKQVSTKTQRALVMARFNSFKTALGERIVQEQSKIFGDAAVAGNTPESLARNVYRTKHKIRMTPIMEVIVLDTEIGNDVTITEQ